MWGRPVRQATAFAPPTAPSPPADASSAAADATAAAHPPKTSVILHRNEINEQQRPGNLVMVPRERGGNPLWEAKLIRSMSAAAENPAAVNCDGLLLYSGSFLKRGRLDPGPIIDSALLKPKVMFTTQGLRFYGKNAKRFYVAFLRYN